MANTDALKQLQQQSSDKLNILAREIIQFTAVHFKYLKVNVMVKDVYDALNNFYFNNNIDWDELAKLHRLYQIQFDDNVNELIISSLTLSLG